MLVELFDSVRVQLAGASNVTIAIADLDECSQEVGWARGMASIQRAFLSAPRPTLVLGLGSKSEFMESGYHRLLELPCVTYLQAPFSFDELHEAIQLLGDRNELSVQELAACRFGATRDEIKRLNRNFTHRLQNVYRPLSLQLTVMKQGETASEWVKDASAVQGKLDVLRVPLIQAIDNLKGFAPQFVIKALEGNLELLSGEIMRLADEYYETVAGTRAPDAQSCTTATTSGERLVDALKRIGESINGLLVTLSQEMSKPEASRC